jgi:hypothetical protein
MKAESFYTEINLKDENVFIKICLFMRINRMIAAFSFAVITVSSYLKWNVIILWEFQKYFLV